MNISKQYLKQVIQEELNKLKKGGRIDEVNWGEKAEEIGREEVRTSQEAQKMSLKKQVP